MPTNKPLENHPRKIQVETFPENLSLKPEDGWVNFHPKFLITKQSVGSEHSVIGLAVFPPGGKHDIHRHPNAEEFQWIIKGSGIARVCDEDVMVHAGEIVFVKKNEYHGFANASETEPAVMIWGYAGASSLEEAGYIPYRQDHNVKPG